MEPLGSKVDRLADSIESLKAAKRAAILGGVRGYDEESGGEWLQAVSNWRQDPQANAYVKSVLGTSDSTGQAIVPNNVVAGIVAQAAINNPYRDLMTVISPVRAAAVDIPYEVTAIQAALLQGAYGSNKDIRDFSFGQATATLYQIAQIADIGNQLLRQSGGAAEQIIRNRLGKAFGLAEANYAGGWAIDPAAGPAGSAPIAALWGINVVRDASLATGQAIVGNFRDCQIFIGDEYRIDVSSEAGTRFDQNITGFRAEEEFGFNAEGHVRTGMFQKVLGL
jgi:hypothetical protein